MTDLATRADPLALPGSTYHVGLSIRGELTVYFADGKPLTCTDVRGMTAVRCADEVTVLPDGRPRLALTRLMTHFHSPETGLLIQQNLSRPNTGTLTGVAGSLLPGDVTFDQYLVIGLHDRLFVNLDPLVMAAEQVTAFPPVGTLFRSRTATLFYDAAELDGGITARQPGDARPWLALASSGECGSMVTHLLDRMD